MELEGESLIGVEESKGLVGPSFVIEVDEGDRVESMKFKDPGQLTR